MNSEQEKLLIGGIVVSILTVIGVLNGLDPYLTIIFSTIGAIISEYLIRVGVLPQ